MFWGIISGKYGKELEIFWKKSWGKINRFSLKKLFLYSTNIFSYIQGFNFSRIMDLNI
jgi:hypothetical protein